MLTQRDLSKKQCGGNVDPERMPATKIEAFVEEFPWIENFAPGPISQVYVSRIESPILNYSLACPISDFDGIHLIDRVGEKIFLVNKEGKEVIAEIRTQVKRYHFCGPIVTLIKNIRGVITPDYPISNVGSVIEQLGETANSICFLISYYRYTKAVIVYKLPKGVSISQWIENEIKLEKKQFQDEVAATV